MDKSANPLRKVICTSFQEEDSGHVEYRYRIIDRLISIKVLWESSYPNTSIKYKLLDFIHHHPPRSLSSLSCSPLSSRITPDMSLLQRNTLSTYR